MPVFSVLAMQLKGATPQLIGVALGAYGLTQAATQLLFGWASDRWGRHRLITLGLGLLLLGSLLGAWATSIQGMIFARCLQGSGAIGSVLLALLTDVVPSEHRTKAMAIIGVSIGISFSVAMVVGHVLAQAFGLSGIFYAIVLLTCVVLGLTLLKLPSAPAPLLPTYLGTLLKPPAATAKRRYFLTTPDFNPTFFVLPLQLASFMAQGNLSASWQFYGPVVTGAFLVMAPVVAWIERRKVFYPALAGTIVVTLITQFALAYGAASWGVWCAAVFGYLVVLNIGEALLPAQVSHSAPAQQRGIAMGLYSTAQFLGIFLGGLLAGLIDAQIGHSGVYWMNAGIAIGWFLWIKTIQCDK